MLLGFNIWTYSILSLISIPTLVFLVRKKEKQTLPPSPPSDPIIGHARSIPAEYPWKTFASWRKKFGDIIYLHVFGRPMLVLNSASVAREILEKRSANFSDRPRIVVLCELMGWSHGLLFLPYGDRFRRQRRLMQRYFNAQEVSMFRLTQENQVLGFLKELLVNPIDFREGVQRLVAGTVLKATYGYSVLPKNDPLVAVLERAATMTGEVGNIGATSIDLFPILRHVPTWFPSWFPGVFIKRHSLKTRKVAEISISVPLADLKARKAAGDTENCFVSKMLDDYEVEQRDDPSLQDDIRMLGAVSYAAGFETTVTSILTFLLMMALHPDASKRAQEEIDRVVGNDRLPTFDDRSELPYIDCILKEAHRINPPAPVGLAHRAMETDHYNGLTLPKGSMILPNIWLMMRDEKYFPDPEVFNPDRHIDIVTGRKENIPGKDDDPSNLVYGFGRRICPGRFFADRTVWLTMACTLACFDIKPFVDPSTGEELPPAIEYLPSVISIPKPFKCTIVPRSERHAQLIQKLLNGTL